MVNHSEEICNNNDIGPMWFGAHATDLPPKYDARLAGKWTDARMPIRGDLQKLTINEVWHDEDS